MKSQCESDNDDDRRETTTHGNINQRPEEPMNTVSAVDEWRPRAAVVGVQGAVVPCV